MRRAEPGDPTRRFRRFLLRIGSGAARARSLDRPPGTWRSVWPGSRSAAGAEAIGEDRAASRGAVRSMREGPWRSSGRDPGSEPIRVQVREMDGHLKRIAESVSPSNCHPVELSWKTRSRGRSFRRSSVPLVQGRAPRRRWLGERHGERCVAWGRPARVRARPDHLSAGSLFDPGPAPRMRGRAGRSVPVPGRVAVRRHLHDRRRRDRRGILHRLRRTQGRERRRDEECARGRRPHAGRLRRRRPVRP